VLSPSVALLCCRTGCSVGSVLAQVAKNETAETKDYRSVK
jgi:hypothetical protein